MIIQLGVIFGGIESALAAGFSKIGSLASTAISEGIPLVAQSALNVGQQYVQGIVSRELNRSSNNDIVDAIKADLRAQANAVSPTVAPGQTAVFSGGPPTGSAFRPATLVPPSIQPVQRAALQVDPGLYQPVPSSTFDLERRPPGPFQGQTFEPVQFGGLIKPAVEIAKQVFKRGGTAARGFDPRTPLGRRMLGAAAGGVAAETAVGVGADLLFPETASAPSFGSFPTSGDPLRITEADIMPGTATSVPVGLPAIGRYQKEANGIRVQWFFFNGNQMLPIDRRQADSIKREAIYRRDVFLGKYIRLKSRRMNPMNVRAFFRAGRRVDAGERICRKMFSEKRKQKTGTVRRKSRKRKK